jgi:hypothetical protein
VVGSYPLSSQAPTPVEVELGCDNILKYRVYCIKKKKALQNDFNTAIKNVIRGCRAEISSETCDK